MKKQNRILKDALISHNVLTEEEVKDCLAQAETANQSLKDFLLENKLVTEKQILICLSQALSIPIADLKHLNIERDVIDSVPIKIAWYYKFLPISLTGNNLTIACATPLDVKMLDEIRVHVGHNVIAQLASQNELMESFKKYYGLASDTIDRILTKEPVKEKSSSDFSGQWIEDIEKSSDDPTVANLVNEIILEAYRKRATDIHIEPYRDKVRFRYRIDGILVDANIPDNAKHFLPSILSRIKILANLSITEKRVPQDGSAVVKTREQQLDLRISTMPTPRGESIVIRILPTKMRLFSLEKLGFDSGTVNIFRELVKKPHGIIFMTGPTGSGKTTTLYACLNEINSTKRKIITIEDPVEYEMDGITQIQVNPKVNFSFAVGLRSILRHDPDIIMVGEVRDLETAEIAVRTALTGHLVFSTLHTNDAASGMTRLIDMGVEPYLVASSVQAYVAQRLVRVICPKCKELTTNSMIGIKEEICRSLGLKSSADFKIYVGRGCDECNNTGYYGRVAIYEILLIDDNIRQAILEKPRSDYIKKIAMQSGMKTLRQNGWQAVLDGITTPSEVMNVTSKDEYVTTEKVSRPLYSLGDAHELLAKSKEVKYAQSLKKDTWQAKNQFEGRVYPRSFTPIDIRYRILKKNENDESSLESEEIEYPTKTLDISAGGLRFTSSSLIPIGTFLDVKMQLEDGRKGIDCLAKVCRVEKNSTENIYTIVSCFLDISSANRVAINKYVEQKLREEELSGLSQNKI